MSVISPVSAIPGLSTMSKPVCTKTALFISRCYNHVLLILKKFKIKHYSNFLLMHKFNYLVYLSTFKISLGRKISTLLYRDFCSPFFWILLLRDCRISSKLLKECSSLDDPVRWKQALKCSPYCISQIVLVLLKREWGNSSHPRTRLIKEDFPDPVSPTINIELKMKTI